MSNEENTKETEEKSGVSGKKKLTIGAAVTALLLVLIPFITSVVQGLDASEISKGINNKVKSAFSSEIEASEPSISPLPASVASDAGAPIVVLASTPEQPTDEPLAVSELIDAFTEELREIKERFGSALSENDTLRQKVDKLESELAQQRADFATLQQAHKELKRIFDEFLIDFNSFLNEYKTDKGDGAQFARELARFVQEIRERVARLEGSFDVFLRKEGR